ncbi:hypothetical protein [Staphylococcus haemolyticus]
MNLWTDLFSPFFVLAQKQASQSTRFQEPEIIFEDERDDGYTL